MYYYQRLRDLREDADLTQKEIANILNDSQQHYQLYESGKREPPFWLIIALAKYYKVSIDYIAGLTNDKGGMHGNTKDEQEILELYNSLLEQEKGGIKERIKVILEQKEPEKLKDNINIKQRDYGTVNINK